MTLALEIIPLVWFVVFLAGLLWRRGQKIRPSTYPWQCSWGFHLWVEGVEQGRRNLMRHCSRCGWKQRHELINPWDYDWVNDEEAR